ncbi:hypothetical protein PINS_up017564 [Pythium insidiosum]|nr:hypothetical protein PINS_up017564 [Pythium insidiosum]
MRSSAVTALRMPTTAAVSREGYWGAPTAMIDWCEANYEYSPYIAEFWNTISNLLFVVLGIYGLARSMKQGFEWRFHMQFIAVIVTGIGSCTVPRHTTTRVRLTWRIFLDWLG